ncbi:MAG: glycosyltransferase [Eubacteriales bacterium]|nr:glycosyltransferase [Eubacteriales bacterium]
MKKVLLLAPMSSVHERFNKINIEVLNHLHCEIHIAANFECGTSEAVNHNLLYKKNIESQGIIVHQIPFQRSSLMKNLSIVKQCRNLFKKEQFDMIHVHTETGGLITRLAMPRNINTKYVYTPHGMSFYKGSSIKTWVLYYPIERWICKKMSYVLAMNQEELEILNGWNKTSAQYIHGIGLDVDAIRKILVDKEAKREEIGIPNDAFLVLSIGELNENKNHEAIIKALAKIDKTNLYYLICGEGHLESYLKELCASCDLSNRVILAGYRRDIPEVLHIADLFAFPSYHEGLPVSVIEAMAAGLPVVCSRIRGNVDLIEDGKGGFLYEPKDIDGIKTAIKKMVENIDIEQMKKINLENVEQFNCEIVKKETMNIYQKVI